MDVSVIIVNYNTLNMTRECIDSIFQKTNGLSFEVILVDNASSDGSKECFEKDSRIRYIYSPENLGFGKANNLGMEQAKGDYFFLLNSDTLLVNNAVREFYEYVAQNETIEHTNFYGCWLLDKRHNISYSFNTLPSIRYILDVTLRHYTSKIGKAPKKDFEKMYSNAPFAMEVGYISGADMFFHRSIYDKFGGFDPIYFMYYEESDWQRRLKELYVKSYVIKGPLIIHLQGASLENKKAKKNIKGALLLHESMFIYMKRYHKRSLYILFRIVYFLLKFFPVLLKPEYGFKDRLKYINAMTH